MGKHRLNFMGLDEIFGILKDATKTKRFKEQIHEGIQTALNVIQTYQNWRKEEGDEVAATRLSETIANSLSKSYRSGKFSEQTVEGIRRYSVIYNNPITEEIYEKTKDIYNKTKAYNDFLDSQKPSS